MEKATLIRLTQVHLVLLFLVLLFYWSNLSVFGFRHFIK
ncbi:hypothetical protein FM107_14885 [Sphingobacterium sp. JB170]|nr:hypothetical protein FM107_14885 [Sphingobacterium sp. JB170]